MSQLTYTQVVDIEAQKILLIAKTYSIKSNIENDDEETIFSFENLLYVLSVGWDNVDVLEIEADNYNDVLHSITYHYQTI